MRTLTPPSHLTSNSIHIYVKQIIATVCNKLCTINLILYLKCKFQLQSNNILGKNYIKVYKVKYESSLAY